MKKLKSIFNIIFLVLTTQVLYAQCPTDNITFNSQEEIDAFATDYPNCTILEHNITIKPQYPDTIINISNLNGLSNLKYIEGKLSIQDCNLNSLNGLNSLDSIGSLEILSCHSLKSFSGLENVKTIHNLQIGAFQPVTYQITGNDSLSTFSGLNSISSINTINISNTPIQSFIGLERIKTLTALILTGCDSLHNFIGLDSLESIGYLQLGSYDTYINGYYVPTSTKGNSNLSNFEGLLQLKHIGNNNLPAWRNGLSILGYGPSSFQGLSSVEEITTLNIVDNNQIQDFTGLDEIKKINHINLGDIKIFTIFGYPVKQIFTCDIKNFTGLNSIDSIQSIRLGRSHLETFTGLEQITELVTLDIQDAPNLLNVNGLDNLESIYQFTLSNTPIKNFLPLTKLKQVNNFSILSEGIESLTGLENLETVHNLHISNAQITNFLPLESLNTINGYLILDNLDSLVAFTNLGNVTHIGSNLQITNNDNLVSLSGLGISSVGYNLRIGGVSTGINIIPQINEFDYIYIETPNNKITSLVGLENLDSIGGSLIVSTNPELTSLNGLSDNLFIGKNIQLGELVSNHYVNNKVAIGNPKLTDLSALNGIEKVYENLSIIGNPNLPSLSGLESIDSIFGDLEITGNHMLTDLNGLNGLNFTDGLIIGDPNTPYSSIGNDTLQSLEGFDNATIASFLSITNNQSLSLCNTLPVCQYLDISSNIATIYNNAAECNSTDEININCSSLLLAGEVFYDYNQNKIHDSNEGTIPNQKIGFNPPGQELLTNQNGYFHKFCNSGESYQLEWIADPNWSLSTDSASFTIPSFTAGLVSNLKKDFGLYPNFTEHSGSINLSSDQTRCNTNVKFFLRYQNTGTFEESGYILIKYDPSCTFVSSTPDSGIIVDTTAFTMVWQYDSIYPFQYQDIEITLGMPDQNSTGTSLQFLAEMYNSSDGSSLLDSYSYTPTVLCSFDPNDKQVMPAGVRDEHYTLHDQKLTYTVRFQNTGNAEAIDIRILDTIDASLDINTLRIVNSSFPVQTSISGQAIEFLFENIWLADSTSNEAESHGFVTYEITPVANLDDYSEIKNTAYIIFDFNDAIITNTTNNTMVTTIPVAIHDIKKTDIAIHPNPADDIIYISARNHEPIDNILIYNTLGKLMLSQKNKEVDVSHFPKGVYMVKVQIGEKIGIQKLIIQ